MRAAFSLFITMLLCNLTKAQTQISLEEISKHIGDSVIVCGNVASSRYLEQVEKSPTFLNLGAAYPKQALTVVIWSDLRKEFEAAPETIYQDKIVCVTGKIQLYRERPQIVLYKRDQIKLQQ